MIRINNVKSKGVTSVKAEVINDLKGRGYMVASSERGARALLHQCGVTGYIYEGEILTRVFPGACIRGYQYSLKVVVTAFYSDPASSDYAYSVNVIRF